MTEQSIVIAGLPDSGKTTFLAALWHLVTVRAHDTALRFKSLVKADGEYLNEIADRWRNAKTQIRTPPGKDRLVSMNLSKSDGEPIRLTFPDLSGESFRDMWEQRDCSVGLADILRKGNGMLVFVNADVIKMPLLTVDAIAQQRALGLPVVAGESVKFDPQFSPTQVKLVDLLQLFRSSPLDVPAKRVSVILSLWDKVAPERRTPEQFLSEKLPLLDQYLRSAADSWDWKVYGLSAQGGEYEDDNKPPDPEQLQRIEGLRDIDEPSERIQLLFGDGRANAAHDLTEPISWLIE